MEIDVGYAGINTLDMYTIVYRDITAFLRNLLCGSEVREELWRLCDGRDSV